MWPLSPRLSNMISSHYFSYILLELILFFENSKCLSASRAVYMGHSLLPRLIFHQNSQDMNFIPLQCLLRLTRAPFFSLHKLLLPQITLCVYLLICPCLFACGLVSTTSPATNVFSQREHSTFVITYEVRLGISRKVRIYYFNTQTQNI